MKIINTVKKAFKKFIAAPKKGRFLTIAKFLGLGLLLLFLLAVIGFFSLFIYYSRDLPRPEKFTEREFAQSTKIFDRTGKVLLYELYGEEKREIIPLKVVPEHLKQALIATEDANFYKHRGVDFKAIIRSVLADLKLKSPAFGASTISQQLIRSTFLTREKTVKRKIREIILTLEMERKYSKDQILEWYINQIPFGPNIYGVETASRTFFNKPAKDISVPEAAVLAALVQAPSRLSPYGSRKDELINRKNYVLNRMAQEHYLEKDEADALKKEEVKFVEMTKSIKAPHFVFYVQDYLLDKYGKDYLEQEGLKVYTTLDWNLQQKAEKAVTDGVKRNKQFNSHNAALVALNPKNGEILTMVGSADWFADPYPKGCVPGDNCRFDPKVNVATYNIGRQPGSSFKPFVYATAFEKGYNDKYVVVDQETDFGIYGGKPYIPQNYDGMFRGPVTLRQALAQSLNVPAVKVLVYLAGLQDSIKTAQRMGITTLTQPLSYYGPSIVLGGGEVKLLDMVSAYGVFATEGLRTPPSAILRIEDSDGNIVEENKKSQKRILTVQTARLINDILSDNESRTPMFGANSPLYFANYQVAAKTGTTSDYKDGWIVGYTPSIAAGVWSGNSDNDPMWNEPGSVVAGPIWHSFMNAVLPTLPYEAFAKPESEIIPIPTPTPSPLSETIPTP